MGSPNILEKLPTFPRFTPSCTKTWHIYTSYFNSTKCRTFLTRLKHFSKAKIFLFLNSNLNEHGGMDMYSSQCSSCEGRHYPLFDASMVLTFDEGRQGTLPSLDASAVLIFDIEILFINAISENHNPDGS